MDKESDIINLHANQALTVSNTAELVSKSAKLFSESLNEYIKSVDKDKNQKLLYINMCSSNLSGSIYQLQCAIDMLNTNSQITWNIINDQEINIKFGTISDDSESDETNSIKENLIETEIKEEIEIKENLTDVDIKEIKIKENLTDAKIKENLSESEIKEDIIEIKEIIEIKNICSNDNITEEYSLSKSKGSNRQMLESSVDILRKYIDPDEPDNYVFIIRIVDIVKLKQFHDGIPYNNQSTRNFWWWCWNEYNAVFKWNLEEGTIYIGAYSKKHLNDCLHKLARIFENI